MASFLKVFTLIVLLPFIFAQCATENANPHLKRSIYDFSTKLTSRLAQDTDNHFVASPFSTWALFATLSFGALNETLDEITNVLNLHQNKCYNKNFFEIIKNITSLDGDEAIFNRSSVLFANNKLSVKEEFKNQVISTEVSDIQIIDPENSVAGAAIINNYVRMATKGHINDVVSPADLQNIFFMLIDALYYKFTWHDMVYDPDFSKPKVGTFHDEKGNPIGNATLLYGQVQFANAANISQIQAKVVELPNGSNDRFSMLIFLPEDGVTLQRVIDNLKLISIRTIFDLFTTRDVFVNMPLFTISTDVDHLEEILVDIGLRTMFDSNDAKFSDISDFPLHISKAVHKAEIDFTGEIKQLMPISCFVQPYPEPLAFFVDKPFLFMLVDKRTELPLITGAYSKPSVYNTGNK